MNRYLKSFLHRGLVFGGFGPLVLAIVYLVLSHTVEGLSLTGGEVFLGVLSTYLLAFVHAGVSVFNQIESWSVGRSLFFHLGTLYLAYSICYLLNRWIPFHATAFLIFTAAFVIGYFAVWLTVVLITRATSKRLNQSLKR